jgi:hypothetical protein
MNTKYNKLKTTTLMTIAVFALIGTTGIGAPAFAGAPPPTECTIPPNNMVGWWPGDGDADDIIGDNDGTEQNGASYDSGKVNHGFSLDGSDDFVNATDSDSLDITGEITIDAWINATTTDIYKTIVAKGNATDGNTINYGLQILGSSVESVSDGTLRFFVFDGTNYDFDDSSTPINSDVLTHVAVTFNATADGNNLEFYIDGVSAGSGSITQDMTPNDDALDIGRHNHKISGDSQYFDGVIDELEIFDRVLSSSEIEAIHDAGSYGKCRTFVEPNMVNVNAKPNKDIANKKLTVLDLPDFDTFDVLYNVTKLGEPTESCKDNDGNDVLKLTNTTGPDKGISELPFMVNYTETFIGIPGGYHCNVEFIGNVTLDFSSETISLANQTAWVNATGSMGYWKNHLDVAMNHFPIQLGDDTKHVLVDDKQNVTDIFKEHKGKQGANKLAAKLLAAAFNIWSFMDTGSHESTYSCIEDTVTWSNGTLSDLGYDEIGENGEPAQLLKSLKSAIGNNHTALGQFNNYGCPLP